MGAGSGADELSDALRELPSVERLAAELAAPGHPVAPQGLRVAVARATIQRRREDLRRGLALPGSGQLLEQARAALSVAQSASLRPVINATGVIVHTNLGRAPLADAASAAVARVAGSYSNLELDMAGGGRGSRQAHVHDLARSLTGAQAALVVNNAAGAVLLSAAALAGPSRAVIVSRGQLIEIGGSFRIPDVIAASGSRLVEVGTTNRTRIQDYERAIAHERAHGRLVGAVLRAHPSNFRTVGFVEEAEIEALCALDVPVIDDVGSGALGERFRPPGGLAVLEQEPSVRRSVAAGSALVCFSGDKLLGGPQAGLIVGHVAAVKSAAAHPLARALRIDKLSLAALEATLALHRDPERARREIPVLAMLDVDPDVLRERAQRLARRLADGGLSAGVVTATARVGGGGLPLLELEGPVVRLECAIGPDAAAMALRRAEPPVVGRVAGGALLLDPRTIAEQEVELVVNACLTSLASDPDRRAPDAPPAV